MFIDLHVVVATCAKHSKTENKQTNKNNNVQKLEVIFQEPQVFYDAGLFNFEFAFMTEATMVIGELI